MDLALSPEQRAFRDEIRGFLETALTPAIRRGAALTSGVFAEPDVYRPWQAALDAKGWLTYFWPASAGGPGWGAVERWIFETECARAGTPVLPGMGLKLVGPVLYTYGTAEQQARFCPRSGLASMSGPRAFPSRARVPTSPACALARSVTSTIMS